MATQSHSIDLGLSAFPDFSAEKYPGVYHDAVRVRNAINILAAYLDTYTGTTGTGTSAFANTRIAVGNNIGWSSFSNLTYDDSTSRLTVPVIQCTKISLATPAAAFTKTYNTASRVVPNATFSNLVTTAATNVTPFGFSTAAQADAIATKVNALAADVLILKQLIVALINDLSATSGIGINAT